MFRPVRSNTRIFCTLLFCVYLIRLACIMYVLYIYMHFTLVINILFLNTLPMLELNDFVLCLKYDSCIQYFRIGSKVT
jgi:hypothetical protein